MTKMPVKLKPEVKAQVLAAMPGTKGDIAARCGGAASTVCHRVDFLVVANEAHQSGWTPLLNKYGTPMRYLEVYSKGPEPAGFELPERPESIARKITNAAAKKRSKINAQFGKAPSFGELLEETRRLNENHTLDAKGGAAFWQYGIPAPLGEKLLLLTVGGVAVIGQWQGMMGDLYITWSYLPKRNKQAERFLLTNGGFCDE